MTLLLTVLVFLSCIALLAIGVVLARKPVKSSCCAASELDKNKTSCSVPESHHKS